MLTKSVTSWLGVWVTYIRLVLYLRCVGELTVLLAGRIVGSAVIIDDVGLASPQRSRGFTAQDARRFSTWDHSTTLTSDRRHKTHDHSTDHMSNTIQRSKEQRLCMFGWKITSAVYVYNSIIMSNYFPYCGSMYMFMTLILRSFCRINYSGSMLCHRLMFES